MASATISDAALRQIIRPVVRRTSPADGIENMIGAGCEGGVPAHCDGIDPDDGMSGRRRSEQRSANWPMMPNPNTAAERPSVIPARIEAPRP